MTTEAPYPIAHREPGCEPGEIEQELDRLSGAASRTEELLTLLCQRLQPVLAHHGKEVARPSDSELLKAPASSLGCRLLETRQHLAAQNDVISDLLHAICL
jgi:hypothetical protein